MSDDETSAKSGERFRQMREALHLSREALARKLGVSASTVYCVERGREPRASYVAQLEALSRAEPSRAAPSLTEILPSTAPTADDATTDGSVQDFYDRATESLTALYRFCKSEKLDGATVAANLAAYKRGTMAVVKLYQMVKAAKIPPRQQSRKDPIGDAMEREKIGRLRVELEQYLLASDARLYHDRIATARESYIGMTPPWHHMLRFLEACDTYLPAADDPLVTLPE